MYRNKKKIFHLTLLVLIQVSLIAPTMIQAQTIDGIIDEPAWILWFEDNDSPSFTTYYSEDSTTIFIGILTNYTEINSNQLQIAFKAAKNDFTIMYSDISGVKFKPNTADPGTIHNYWAATRLGLPIGVDFKQGITNGKISYEISISKVLLGKYGENIPNKFHLWLMYTTESNGGWIWSIIDAGGEVNFYPESRSEWWFSLVDSDSEQVEIPVFHAPEIPYGTILSIVSMLGAMFAISKKKPPFSNY